MFRVMPGIVTTPTPVKRGDILPVKPPGTERKSSATTYELCLSTNRLPTINCSKGVMHAWLSRAKLARFNAFIRRHRKALTLLHVVATASTTGALFLPPQVAAVCGVIACVLNFPGASVSFLALRYDMIKIAMRTYEFWYLSTMSTLTLALIAVLLNDYRSLAMLPGLLSFEVVVLIDANYRAVHTTMGASLFSGLILGIFTVLTLLGLVSDANNPAIFSYGRRSVSVVDIIVNCGSSVVLMLFRNALRKYFVLDGATPTVRCIAYRCRVRLCITDANAATNDTASQSGMRKVLVRKKTSSALLLAPMTQLQLEPSREVFDTTQTPFECFHRPGINPFSPTASILLHATSFIGLTTTIAVFIIEKSSSHPVLTITSCASTLGFSLAYLTHAQRRLLRMLCTSFDFAFVSLQLTIAHLCVCDSLYWDSRSLAVLSSWLWLHWVLTIDAVTPVMRVRLGYRRHLTGLVVVLFIVAHIFLSLELTVWNRLALQDRAVVATTIGGHRVQVRVVPLLFGRMATTVCWSCRLLVRLMRQAPDELIMLQGVVMYYDHERAERAERRRRQNAVAVSRA